MKGKPGTVPRSRPLDISSGTSQQTSNCEVNVAMTRLPNAHEDDVVVIVDHAPDIAGEDLGDAL